MRRRPATRLGGPANERERHGPHTLKVWKGTVVGLYGNDVFVELGPRTQGVISRREFVRYCTLLGMSAGAAYMWAGKITGQPFAPPARAQDMPKGGTIKVSMRVPKVDNPCWNGVIAEAAKVLPPSVDFDSQMAGTGAGVMLELWVTQAT